MGLHGLHRFNSKLCGRIVRGRFSLVYVRIDKFIDGEYIITELMGENDIKIYNQARKQILQNFWVANSNL